MSVLKTLVFILISKLGREGGNFLDSELIENSMDKLFFVCCHVILIFSFYFSAGSDLFLPLF
jgi:hypothetical protein